MRKGFIYRIDYVGDHPLIKGVSYAGSKKESQNCNWSKYFGSPSTNNCERCRAWRLEAKMHPHLFKKTIVHDVTMNESIIECEIEYLLSVSDDITVDDRWLNRSIPRIGAFPEFCFTHTEMKDREVKRKLTMLNKTGFEHNFQNVEKMKASIYAKYGVENINQLAHFKIKNSNHKKQYFANMTEEQRKLHGLKSLMGKDPCNVRRGIEKQKHTKSNWTVEYKLMLELNRQKKWRDAVDKHTPEKRKEISNACKYASTMLRKQYYITIEFLNDNSINSKFLNEWIKDGFARDGIMDRVRSNSREPLFSRNLKKWVRIIAFDKKQPQALTQLL